MDDLFGGLPPPKTAKTSSSQAKPSGGSSAMDLFGDLPPPSAVKKTPAKETMSLFEGLPPAALDKERKESVTTPSETKASTIPPALGNNKRKRDSIDSLNGSSVSRGGAKSEGGLRIQPKATKKLVAFHYGSKGRRRTMEDEHVIITDDQIHTDFPHLPAGTRFSAFGVYDGHGGSDVARLVRDHLHGHVFGALQDTCLEEGRKAADATTPSAAAATTTAAAAAAAAAAVPQSVAHVTAALTEGFKRMAAQVRECGEAAGWRDGCCAVLLVVVDDRAFVANLGDSKAILCRRKKCTTGPTAGATATPTPASSQQQQQQQQQQQRRCGLGLHKFMCGCEPGAGVEAVALSVDHKPIVVGERRRVEAAGGRVENGRVNGMLEVSRSFGDLYLKKYGVSSEPDVRVRFSLAAPPSSSSSAASTPSSSLKSPGAGTPTAAAAAVSAAAAGAGAASGGAGTVTIPSTPLFLILGCDGLWTVYSKDMATTYVRNRLLAHARHHNMATAAGDAAAVAGGGGGTVGSAGTGGKGGGATTTPTRGKGKECSRRDCVLPEHHWNLTAVTRSLVDDAIHEKGCQDNVTALVVLIE